MPCPDGPLLRPRRFLLPAMDAASAATTAATATARNTTKYPTSIATIHILNRNERTVVAPFRNACTPRRKAGPNPRVVLCMGQGK